MINKTILPDFLSHYYENSAGPFSNLSLLPLGRAEQILANIRKQGDRFASQRPDDYMRIRLELEDRVKKLFLAKGGEPKLARPHYMILGACTWLKDWYVDGREIRIPLASFPARGVSFTYGDTFPAMKYDDGKPYRGQVYAVSELGKLIELYGLPQEWNPDGKCGPERYIEAQVWDDMPLKAYLGV